MKRGVLVFLAICAFAIAMVPRDRRAEELLEKTAENKTVCASKTPCAWAVYKRNDEKTIDIYITNTYCSCGSGTSCLQDEEDQQAQAYEYRCREPEHDEKDEN